MAKKIRLIRTMIVEYIPNPACYPKGMTIEQMAQLDANVCAQDREIIFDSDKCIADEVEWVIVGE